MSTPLADHVGELVEALHDLRRRLRQAARVEVARAVGEALRDFTQAMICGSVRYPATARSAAFAWDDPWREPADEPWQHRSYAQEVDAEDSERLRAVLVSPVLAMGLCAARWGFLRTRRLGPAALIGLLIALAASAGGPTIKGLLEAWSTANDLLSYPSLDPKL